MGISGVITLYVAVLAYIKKSDNMITATDWLFFVLAMSSLPLWYLTANPFWAVVILLLWILWGLAQPLGKHISTLLMNN